MVEQVQLLLALQEREGSHQGLLSTDDNPVRQEGALFSAPAQKVDQCFDLALLVHRLETKVVAIADAVHHISTSIKLETLNVHEPIANDLLRNSNDSLSVRMVIQRLGNQVRDDDRLAATCGSVDDLVFLAKLSEEVGTFFLPWSQCQVTQDAPWGFWQRGYGCPKL